jgi:hypothetical protein
MRQGNHGRWPAIAIAGLAVLCLYVLSLGPVNSLARHGYIDDPFLQPVMVLYLPLAFLEDYVPPFRHAVEWYKTIWP